MLEFGYGQPLEAECVYKYMYVRYMFVTPCLLCLLAKGSSRSSSLTTAEPSRNKNKALIQLMLSFFINSATQPPTLVKFINNNSLLKSYTYVNSVKIQKYVIQRGLRYILFCFFVSMLQITYYIYTTCIYSNNKNKSLY